MVLKVDGVIKCEKCGKSEVQVNVDVGDFYEMLRHQSSCKSKPKKQGGNGGNTGSSSTSST